MRLIDADNALELFQAEYQNTENLIKKGEKHLDSLAEGYTEAAHIIKYISPTVDAVPVVRCRNCKHWNEETGWCDIHSHFQGSDGEFCHPWESNDWKVFPVYYFCADGERVAKTTRGDENGKAKNDRAV